MPTYEKEIYDLINTIRQQVRTSPVILGGVSGENGGSGSPPGGFVGKLSQGSVCFDDTEAATSDIPEFTASLLNNLNRIRLRLQILEQVLSGVTSSGTGHVIRYSGVNQARRQNLNFTGLVTVTDDIGNDSTNVEVVVEHLPSLRIGTETDYVNIDTSGNILFEGTATIHDDVQYSLIGQKVESPASHITQNDPESSVTYDNDCRIDDYMTMNVQLPHGWKIGSDLHPHLHWWQTSSDLPNWMMQYRWQMQGEPKTTAWTNVIRTSEAFTYTSGLLNQITVLGSGITPPVGNGLSDIVQVRLIRDKINESTLFASSDNFAGSVDAVSFDIHIEKDTIGSREEYVK